jgi:lytic murein transglycosylase
MHARWLALGGIVALAVACAPASAQDAAPLATCISALQRELPAHPEVTARTFETYTRDVQDLRPVIENATRAQPEFQIPIWDYLARRVDAQRIADGRALLQAQAVPLDAIARRHGVDPATTVAVLGIETDYGRVGGRYPVVDATLSRACLNLKSRERKQHFFDALWLLQEGVVRPESFTGSWAGAFGMTQFMPGTFRRYMRDDAGSPPADIVTSMPDALATTARYLRSLGWSEQLRWGVEVRASPELAASNALESDHACLEAQRPSGRCRTVGAWAQAGIVRVDGSPLLQTGADPLGGRDAVAALLMPAGVTGPAWLVTPNYQAIWRYNRADTYALAIGVLSDALRGEPPPQVPWPTDDPGLSRAEFREVQQLLRERGYCDVTVDGSEGPRTGTAIRAEELRLGWPDTARAGSKLLRSLRESRGEPAVCAAEK